MKFICSGGAWIWSRVPLFKFETKFCPSNLRMQWIFINLTVCSEKFQTNQVCSMKFKYWYCRKKSFFHAKITTFYFKKFLDLAITKPPCAKYWEAHMGTYIILILGFGKLPSLWIVRFTWIIGLLITCSFVQTLRSDVRKMRHGLVQLDKFKTIRY